MSKPSQTNYPVYFQRYVDQVPEEDLFIAFQNQFAVLEKFLLSVPEEKYLYTYAEGKWTLKEILQHIIDTERIFNYRALCIARKEKNSLPGFDENLYAAHSNANARNWKDMVDELIAVRNSTEILFKNFSEEALEFSGISNNNPVTVISLGFILIGHFYHHKKIIEERYL